ncbi:Uncharacterised protein [Acinetobacter baumannii]|nr:Uncharacterised protein [Acinetobacter baumannii]
MADVEANRVGHKLGFILRRSDQDVGRELIALGADQLAGSAVFHRFRPLDLPSVFRELDRRLHGHLDGFIGGPLIRVVFPVIRGQRLIRGTVGQRHRIGRIDDALCCPVVRVHRASTKNPILQRGADLFGLRPRRGLIGPPDFAAFAVGVGVDVVDRDFLFGGLNDVPGRRENQRDTYDKRGRPPVAGVDDMAAITLVPLAAGCEVRSAGRGFRCPLTLFLAIGLHKYVRPFDSL